MSRRVVIIGCGLFGVTAAVELRRRGWSVRVLEASAPPAPEAGSTDISKMIRLEYGDDEVYTALAERALERWPAWSEGWERQGLPRLFHQVGLLLVCRDAMKAGTFEHDSFHTLRQRGHALERIGGSALSERFPAWSDSLSDGFLHPDGGYVESAGAVWALTRAARAAGVEILTGTPVSRVSVSSGRAVGVEARDGELHAADHVLVAAGSWSQDIVPELERSLARRHHPVWHLRPARPDLFHAERFPVFTADISNTGYYGFPLHPVHAVVKVGHHGLPVDPERPDVDETTTAAMRDFLASALPDLADAELVHSTLCPYSDTPDEHFWISRSPDVEGLTVAAGGSGHAFKFAPILGDWIADTVERGAPRDVDHDLASLWRWRPELEAAQGFDPSRCRV